MRLGVDIGGTGVKVGLFNSEIELLRKSSFPFPYGNPAVLVQQLRRTAETLLNAEGMAAESPEHIGVVVPGSVSGDCSTVLHAYNLGFHDVPLRQLLQKEFPGCSVSLCNDADGAALGELSKGALQGCKTGVFLTLGTGLGGGIILNGSLFRGGCGNGTEPGHAILGDGGRGCTCGNAGCAEAYCSAAALAELGKEASLRYEESLLVIRSKGNPKTIDAKLVVDCAGEGDPAAKEAFAAYVGHLSSYCASLFNVLDPEIIAIGGGLSGAGEFLFAPLREETHKKCFFENHGKLVAATLGNDAGLIGAAVM